MRKKRYIIQPDENIISRERKEPKILRIQCQVEKYTQTRRNQKVIENGNKLLEVKFYPKKGKPKIEKPKLDIDCPRCNQRLWIEFDITQNCQNRGPVISNSKHQVDKKVLRQDKMFSIRLTDANYEIRQIYFSMANIRFRTTKVLISGLQSFK